MPFAFAGLMSVYSRSRRPDVPFRKDAGSGDELTISIFDKNGQKTGSRKTRRLVKSREEWKDALSGNQFAVLREGGTERAFTGEYWKDHSPGIYDCAGCGTTLFRSQDKYDSGTGWPSFTAPAAESNVEFKRDHSLLEERTEVLCARCGGHLGHVFSDGPGPTGLRYCMNSAALAFEAAS